jgi:predicted Zn-dependent protease
VALFQLVKLSYDTNEYNEAEKALTRYVGRHPHDIHMVYSLGGIYYQTGQWEGALRLMNNILALDPTNNQALMLIAQIQKQQMPQKQPA